MLTLTGDNSYTGTTTINAGSTLQVGGNNALGSGEGCCTSDLEVDGTLDLNGYSPTVNALNGNGTITSSTVGLSSTLSVGDGDASGTFSGVLADGAGQLALAQVGNGTLVLTGDNDYTGTTTINTGGALQVGNGYTTGMLRSGIVEGNGTLVFDCSDAVTLDSTLSGALNVTQEGAGELTLTGDNSYTGTTTISACSTLQVGGNNALGQR